MSRQIKFRVYDEFLKVMSGPDNLSVSIRDGRIQSVSFRMRSDLITSEWSSYNQNGDGLDAERYKLMQFTGLKDKNGTEIYEGDVLRLSFDTITMDGYVKPKEDGEWIFYKDEGNFLGVHHNREHVTVIGNVHEHPELLTKSLEERI